MSFDTAKAVILEAFASSDCEHIEFSFLGGEPFAAFERLREISEWIWSEKRPKEYRISASTNGTLLSGEIKEWLIKNHKRFWLSLSYDGGEISQNKNRSASNSKIDLRFFHKYWQDTPVKMTITEETVPNLFRDIVELNKAGIAVNDTFAGGVPEWSTESLSILSEQLNMLVPYYLEHPEIRPSDLLNIDLKGVLYADSVSCIDCGAGDTYDVYDYDGKKYPCHLLSPLVLDDTQLKAAGAEWNHAKDFCEPCRSCSFNSICPSCAGHSFCRMGTICRREPQICALFKRQLYYACMFQIKKILKTVNICDKDKAVFIAVKKIMRSKEMQEFIHSKSVYHFIKSKTG